MKYKSAFLGLACLTSILAGTATVYAAVTEAEQKSYIPEWLIILRRKEIPNCVLHLIILPFLIPSREEQAIINFYVYAQIVCWNRSAYQLFQPPPSAIPDAIRALNPQMLELTISGNTKQIPLDTNTSNIDPSAPYPRCVTTHRCTIADTYLIRPRRLGNQHDPHFLSWHTLSKNQPVHTQTTYAWVKRPLYPGQDQSPIQLKLVSRNFIETLPCLVNDWEQKITAQIETVQKEIDNLQEGLGLDEQALHDPDRKITAAELMLYEKHETYLHEQRIGPYTNIYNTLLAQTNASLPIFQPPPFWKFIVQPEEVYDHNSKQYRPLEALSKLAWRRTNKFGEWMLIPLISKKQEGAYVFLQTYHPPLSPWAQINLAAALLANSHYRLPFLSPQQEKIFQHNKTIFQAAFVKPIEPPPPSPVNGITHDITPSLLGKYCANNTYVSKDKECCSTLQRRAKNMTVICAIPLAITIQRLLLHNPQ